MSQETGAQGKLARVAGHMVDNVRNGRRPFAYTKLAHGLELIMERSWRGYRLALAREVPSRPSDLEVTICRKAFGVPAYAEIEREQKMGKGGVQRNVCNITWSAGEEE